ncbi:MAG TPA: hypothetical protein VF588_00090 [Pyrinomonadaceae bacterium]|jgi:hypothetical protein
MPSTKSKSKTGAAKAKPSAKKSKPAAKPSKAKKGAAAGVKSAASKSKPKSAQAAKAKPSKATAAKASKAKAAPAPETRASSKPSASGPKVTAKGGAAKAKAPKEVLDFGEFPAGSVTRQEVTLCLACIFSLFTKQMGLAPRTAYAEIRGYEPTVAELTAREPARPFFRAAGEKNPRCPYCDAAKRWHAPLRVYRVEGGKATDAARRALLKRLPAKDGRFQAHDEKHTSRQVFFEWLERLGQELDFEEDAGWMPAAAREYLQRREPKTDWAEVFKGARQVRRSQRLEEGWERDGARLFLAPALYDDVLLVQYLVSRSHRHGGRTFEGRLTLRELARRMRYGGHLEAHGIDSRDEFEILEQLVERLTGGDAPAKLHFIIDRRDLLDTAKEVYDRQT